MAEKAKIQFDIDGSGAVDTLEELELKAASLREELGRAKIGSQAYKELNQELVQTTKKVKNLELGFEALDREQVAAELGGVAGAVGDITSAVVLLGGENENLEAMVANIEKGIGISMAFKGAIEGLSSAWKLLNNVMRANPIGLIIAAVALLITGVVALIMKWDKLGKMFTSTGKKIKAQTDRLGKNKKAILALIGPIGWVILAWEKLIEIQEKNMSQSEKNAAREERLRRAQGKAATKRHKKREEEILREQELRKKAFEESQEIFDLEIDRMEAEGKNADMLKKAKIEATIEEKEAELKTIRDLLDSWTQYYTDLFRISGKSREDFLAMMKGQGIDLMALQEEANQRIIDAQNEVFAAETELIRFNRELREKNAKEEEKEEDKSVEVKKAARERYLKELKKLEERRLKAEQEARKLELSLIEDDFQRKREIAQFEFEQSIAQLDSNIEEENRLIIAKREQLNQKLKEIDDQQRAEEKAARQELVNEVIDNAEKVFNIAENFNKLVSSKELKRIEEKKARGEQLTKSEIKRLQRQDKIQKAFALAQIAADTARGISGAIAAGAGIPFPGNIPAIISGVAAVLSGAVQAQAVLGESPDIPSTADIVAGSEAGGGTEQVPNIEAAQFGSTLLNDQKVFVLESDITETQNNVSVIEAQATFG